jgi:tRNA threonylcarbamoyladenosine biosynthesis protein TsaB
MKILAVDTSSSYLSLAVSRGSKIIGAFNKELKKPNHAKYLIPEVSKLLKRASLDLKDIDLYCLGLGPGSFTGLRIALSTVKGFYLVFPANLLGIASIDAVAYNVQNENALIVCIQDARKNKAYGCLYERKKGQLDKLSDYLLIDFASFMNLIKKKTQKLNKQIIFTATGCRKFEKEIRQHFPKALFASRKKWYPYAENLIKLAQVAIKKGVSFTSIDELEPLYLHSKYANVTKPKEL